MTTTDSAITLDELQLAARNHGMPLEALRYDVTPAGLHYLLIHYDIPVVDPSTWVLEVNGAVHRPYSLGLESVRAMPTTTAPVTFECAGNGRARLHPRPISQPWLFEAVGTAEWTGVSVADLLDRAGPAGEAIEVVFTGLDRGVEGGVEQAYQRSLTLDEAKAGGVILAHTMNGQPLLPQHGFPLRLVVPGWYGMTNVKWVTRMTVVTEPFAGHQQAESYRMRTEEGEAGVPVERMLPRSLMIPPGIPDFMTRDRFLEAGPVTLTGRAWSGFGEITSVEVSTDGGTTWQPASLDPPVSSHAWRGWSHTWPATPGEAVLCSRATDETGRTQGAEPEWNLGGYQVNAIQRVRALVR